MMICIETEKSPIFVFFLLLAVCLSYSVHGSFSWSENTVIPGVEQKSELPKAFVSKPSFPASPGIYSNNAKSK